MKQETNTTETSVEQVMQFGSSQTVHDLKNSILVVSIIANLVVLITWILLQITSQYDAQLAGALLGR